MVSLVAVLALAVSAGAQTAPPRLVIEVSEQNPTVTEPLDITVRIYDPDVPSRLLDPEDPDSLIEIRNVSGSSVPIRLALTRQSEGVYTTSFSFFDEGTWQVVALPDVVDRTLLPPDSTPQVTVEVSAGVFPGDAAGREAGRAGTIAVIALIAGGVLVTVLAGPWLRRPKGQPPAPPVGHDTWWASP